jgi:hypothetical protein
MKAVELAALRDLEAAELAVHRAIAEREAAREHLEVIVRRECRRERAKARGPHLELIAGRVSTLQPMRARQRGRHRP